MNEKFTNKQDQEDAHIADILQTMAQQTDAHPIFKTELEQKLKAAHKPKKAWALPSFKSFAPALGLVLLIVAVG